jgi:transposase
MQNKNTEVDFSNQKFFIGFDVHKKNWKATIRTNQMELRTFSMNPQPDELVRYL